MRQPVPRKKGPSMASLRAPYQAKKQPRQRSPFGVKASAGKPTPSHRKACDHKRGEHNRKRDSATRVVMATKQSRSNRGQSKLVGRRSRLARKLTLQELHNTPLKNGIGTRATMFSHRGPNAESQNQPAARTESILKAQRKMLEHASAAAEVPSAVLGVLRGRPRDSGPSSQAARIAAKAVTPALMAAWVCWAIHANFSMGSFPSASARAEQAS